MSKFEFATISAQTQAVIATIAHKKFSSHLFIKLLAQKFPHDYIDVLTAYRASKQPFAAAHLGLSKSLSKVPGVKYMGMTTSKDIFGQTQTCAEWIRT